MPTFKVKSTIKKDGQLYKAGDEIELTVAEAKDMGDSLEADKRTATPAAPRTEAEVKAKKEADQQKKKLAAAKEKANDEVTDELNRTGKPEGDVNDDSNDADLNQPTTTNVSRETTQEDLDFDPTLVEQGVKIGDVREYPTVDTSATDNGGDNL